MWQLYDSDFIIQYNQNVLFHLFQWKKHHPNSHSQYLYQQTLNYN